MMSLSSRGWQKPLFFSLLSTSSPFLLCKASFCFRFFCLAFSDRGFFFSSPPLWTESHLLPFLTSGSSLPLVLPKSLHPLVSTPEGVRGLCSCRFGAAEDRRSPFLDPWISPVFLANLSFFLCFEIFFVCKPASCSLPPRPVDALFSFAIDPLRRSPLFRVLFLSPRKHRLLPRTKRLLFSLEGFSFFLFFLLGR